jgi:hypothetical protein
MPARSRRTESESMGITEIDVLRPLESDGSVWTEYFVLNSLVIVRRNAKGALMERLIDDNELYAATKAFLVSRGHAVAKAEDLPPALE